MKCKIVILSGKTLQEYISPEGKLVIPRKNLTIKINNKKITIVIANQSTSSYIFWEARRNFPAFKSTRIASTANLLGNTKTTDEICSKLIIKTQERCHRSGVFIANFEQISHIRLVFIVKFEQINTSWEHNFIIFEIQS